MFRLLALTTFASLTSVQASCYTTNTSVISREASAEEKFAEGGAISLVSTDLELLWDGTHQNVLIVFQLPEVPHGAMITAASILFDVDQLNGDWIDVSTGDIIISGDASTDAAMPSVTPFNVTNRIKTTAKSAWSPAPSLAVHDVLVTSNIQGVVQEIVGTDGWEPGNNMGFIFSPPFPNFLISDFLEESVRQSNNMAGRWVESYRVNNGVMTPQLSVSWCSPCAQQAAQQATQQPNRTEIKRLYNEGGHCNEIGNITLCGNGTSWDSTSGMCISVTGGS